MKPRPTTYLTHPACLADLAVLFVPANLARVLKSVCKKT